VADNRMRQFRKSLAAVVLGATVSACAATDIPAIPRVAALGAPACPGGGEPMQRLELLFGLTRKEGDKIGTAEWQAFVDAEVTPRFPEGLTVLRGYGQWRTKHGVINRVLTHVLVIWYRPGGDSETKIAAIRAAYKTQFSQDSVMRVDAASCVSF
jgi:Protein of unknown function (DUF3574)